MASVTTGAPMAMALRAAAAGDELAFERIVAAYHDDLVRVAYGICGERELALDAVQAAWLIAWRKLRTVRDPDSLRSWLVAVAANEARHVVRRRGPSAAAGPSGDVPGDPARDPGSEIRRLDLVSALRRLSPDDRALIAMRYGADLDSGTIAPILGLTASGVRARLLRLMVRLREELGDG